MYHGYLLSYPTYHFPSVHFVPVVHLLVSLATHVPRLASVTHFSFPSLGRVTRVARATTRR